MRTYRVGDAWTEACLPKAQEALEEARASSARRGLLRDVRPLRRPARIWLGCVLVTVGYRLPQSPLRPAVSR